ncbi:hypothetical protein [Hymenobacter antarcticus]|uniref:Uncharacterized protein n=1 Tax=Hymenobacter antarcticus TaxID=486270 RepID=A0ABP7QYW1_9BACT
MKRIFLSAALALAVAGSWAFYPKATAEPAGYMMVISTLVLPDPTMLTITPDGQQMETKIKGKGFNINNVDLTRDDLDKSVLNKPNELHRIGWRVAHITSTEANSRIKNTYLLEKQ